MWTPSQMAHAHKCQHGEVNCKETWISLCKRWWHEFGLRCPGSQDPLCAFCNQKNYLCSGLLKSKAQQPQRKKGSSSPSCSRFVGSPSVAYNKTLLWMFFYLGPSECVTWGAWDEAREGGQTSTPTHTHMHRYTRSSVFLQLASFLISFGNATQ